MEKKFVNNNFHYAELIPLSNGNSWTLEALCREIANKYRIKNYHADIVVVWLDLEKQCCGSAGVEKAIRDVLIAEGADPYKLCVCVPDRMTENAVLADVQAMTDKFGLAGYVYGGDGINGKYTLAQYFGAADINYKETYHGVEMMKAMRLSRSAANSPSVASFYNSIAPLAECWWF